MSDNASAAPAGPPPEPAAPAPTQFLLHQQAQREIQEKTEILQTLLNHVPAMIVMVDRDNRFLVASREFEERLGWHLDPTDRQDQDLVEALYPDPEMRQAVLEFAARADGRWEEFQTRTKDGRLIDTNWAAVRLSDGTLISVGKDISERKRAEEALRHSEARLKEAQRLAHTGYWERDLITNQITGSDEAVRLIGLPAGQSTLSLAQFQAMIHPDDRQLQQEALQAALQGAQRYDVEYRIVGPDGEVRCVHSWDEIERDPTGRPIRMFGAVQDITERKRAEEQLRRHAARIGALADILRASAEAGLDYRRLLDTVAQRTAEVIGDACVLTLFSDDRQRALPVAFHHADPQALALMEHAFRHAWQGGMDTDRFRSLMAGEATYLPEVDEAAYRAATEPEFWPFVDQVGISSALIVPLQVQGRVIGTLGLTRDRGGSAYTRDDQVLLQDLADRAALTIQNARLFRETSRQRERLGLLNARLADAQESERRAVARELHDEIGQLLYALSANLEAIQISPEASPVAGRLADSADLVEEALQKIRDLALELRPSMLDDFGLVPAAAWLVERQAERAGFEADFTAEPPGLRLPPALETTVYRLIQAALTNVARHAQARHAHVTVRLRETEVEVLIADDGLGFDVAAALERARQGDTLGLLSMEERARLAGGDLEIESAPGQGTQVRARFHLDGADPR